MRTLDVVSLCGECEEDDVPCTLLLSRRFEPYRGISSPIVSDERRVWRSGSSLEREQSRRKMDR